MMIITFPAVLSWLTEAFKRKTSVRSTTDAADASGDGETVQRTRRAYRVALTGGPCGGKTTALARLNDFFTERGYKVFMSPEAANILLGGGVNFEELTAQTACRFQENLLKTMMRMEDTFFELAEAHAHTHKHDKVLVICDRGAMDATAFISSQEWDEMKDRNSWREIDIRDNRYDQVIHLVTAARGARSFYSLDGHDTRREDYDSAIARDDAAQQAWNGHPHLCVIDNSTNFERKIERVISAICSRLNEDVQDRFEETTVKRKYLVRRAKAHPVPYKEVQVVHDYLLSTDPSVQARVKKHGSDGLFAYQYTIRNYTEKRQVVERRQQITSRQYQVFLQQRDPSRSSVYKTRQQFMYQDHSFRLDRYLEPCPTRCKGLMLLEVYTTNLGRLDLPPWLDVAREVTHDKDFSMANLARLDDE